MYCLFPNNYKHTSVNIIVKNDYVIIVRYGIQILRHKTESTFIVLKI